MISQTQTIFISFELSIDQFEYIKLIDMNYVENMCLLNELTSSRCSSWSSSWYTAFILLSHCFHTAFISIIYTPYTKQHSIHHSPYSFLFNLSITFSHFQFHFLFNLQFINIILVSIHSLPLITTTKTYFNVFSIPFINIVIKESIPISLIKEFEQSFFPNYTCSSIMREIIHLQVGQCGNQVLIMK